MSERIYFTMKYNVIACYMKYSLPYRPSTQASYTAGLVKTKKKSIAPQTAA